MITRAEVINKAKTLWPLGTVPYNQSAIHPGTGYRQDCSGYASMCWGIPPNENNGWGGQSTVTLVTRNYIQEIQPADLKPGDAVGICGPNTGGDAGHIVIFEKWVNDDPNDDHYWMYEQAGGQNGPIRRIVNYPYDGAQGQWKAWRLRTISEGPSLPPPATATPGYEPLGYPSSMLLGGQQRGVGLQTADNWGQEHFGHSPYDAPGAFTESYRSARLRRIEEKVTAVATRLDETLIDISLEDADIAAIAELVAARITDSIAEAVAAKIAARMQA